MRHPHDEVDYDIRNNLIEENETKLNDEDGDDTEVNDKERDEKIDTESSTS